MMRFLLSVLVFAFIVCAVTAQYPSRKPNEVVPEVDPRCLDCICQASSNCDETIKCHNSGGGGYFCGPYVISWAYWHDAGRPGDKGRAHDFEACLNNRTCAEQAVKGYMRKYGQDCDSTGQIDCYDYAVMHKTGYGGCKNDAIYSTDYWGKFETCYSGQPAPDGVDRADYDYAGGQPQQPHVAQPPVYDYGEGQLQGRNYRQE